MPKTHSKPATRLTLSLGPRVVLIVHRDGQRDTRVDMDKLVVNFQEALDEPHYQFRLQDYCGEKFFKNRTKTASRLLYQETQSGNVDGSDAFVVFGAYVGALLANLEMLYRPKEITLNGPLAAYFDAWSHSMGKTRKKILGERPEHNVKITNAQGKTVPLGNSVEKKTDAVKRRKKK